MCGKCYISRIGEVLLSISSAYHIHLLCKMHFESCSISHDYQSKRYENRNTKASQIACLCNVLYCVLYHMTPIEHQFTHISLKLKLKLKLKLPQPLCTKRLTLDHEVLLEVDRPWFYYGWFYLQCWRETGAVGLWSVQTHCTSISGLGAVEEWWKHQIFVNFSCRSTVSYEIWPVLFTFEA